MDEILTTSEGPGVRGSVDSKTDQRRNFVIAPEQRVLITGAAGFIGNRVLERLLERARHLGRLAHRQRPLGDGLGDRLDVHRLEVFFVEARARRLAGHAEDGDGVGDR